MFVSKLSLLLILSVLSIPSIVSNSSGLEKIMDEADSQGLSVVYNTRGQELPLIFNPISKMVTTLQPMTVLKFGLLYSAALYVLTFLFPAAFGVSARSARTASLDFDYDYIYRSMNTISERLSNYVTIPEPECRYRAICETATYIATKVPAINDWAKKVSGAFFLNLANPYSKAWINGMMQIDCNTTYSTCYESPYKTIINRFVAKR